MRKLICKAINCVKEAFKGVKESNQNYRDDDQSFIIRGQFGDRSVN